jgi:hypothetical protein
MPIDPKEALQYLGVNAEEMENIDAFKAHVSTTYVPRDQAHKDPEIAKQIFGKVNNGLRTRLKGVGKELGIDAKFDELDPADGIDLLAASAKARTAELSQQLDELKKGIGKPGKEVEELTTKYNEAKKLADDLTGRLGDWESKYNNLEQTVQQRERQARIDAQWERAIGGLKFNEGVTPLAVKGFHAAVREKFAVDFDDEGTPYAIDAVAKKRVPNPNKAHDSLSLDDLVKSYAEQEKLIGGNPQGGKPVRSTTTLLGGQQQQHAATDQPTTGRRVMPPLRSR